MGRAAAHGTRPRQLRPRRGPAPPPGTHPLPPRWATGPGNALPARGCSTTRAAPLADTAERFRVVEYSINTGCIFRQSSRPESPGMTHQRNPGIMHMTGLAGNAHEPFYCAIIRAAFGSSLRQDDDQAPHPVILWALAKWWGDGATPPQGYRPPPPPLRWEGACPQDLPSRAPGGPEARRPPPIRPGHPHASAPTPKGHAHRPPKEVPESSVSHGASPEQTRSVPRDRTQRRILRGSLTAPPPALAQDVAWAPEYLSPLLPEKHDTLVVS